MRINRGCGCLLLVLGGLNFLFVVAAAIGLVAGTITIQLGLLALGLFGANMVASFMLGLAGLRGQTLGAASGAGEADAGEADAGEADADEGSE